MARRGRSSSKLIGPSSSSGALLGLLLVVSLVMLQGGVQLLAAAQPREWPVGDGTGWTFDVVGWSNYKPFREGDVLLFRYDARKHNVVEVGEDAVAYAMCQVPANATVHSSGNDSVTLSRGVTFFLCGVPGHCQRNMKIAVTAAPVSVVV